MLIEKTINWSNHDWLWSSNTPAENVYVVFKQALTITDATQVHADNAWLAIGCTGRYKLSINQQRIHCGPCREVAPFVSYDVLDLSPYLKDGINDIQIIAYNAGIPTQSSGADQAGLLLAGTIINNDLSDRLQWKAAICSQHHASWRLGGCLGWAENIDLRNITIPELAPIAIQTFADGDSTHALPRSIPALSGDIFMAHVIHHDEDCLLLDFKHEVLGLIDLRCEADRHCTLEIYYAEILTDGELNHRKQNMDYRDRIHLGAGPQKWESFDARAGRYVLIRFNGARQHIQNLRLQVHEQHYPFSKAQLPNNPQDKEICRVAARTIELCSEDIQSDCPWRERAQYLDPYAYINAMQILFNDLQPIKKWLLQLARGCKDRGYLPMCYPSSPGNTVIPDFQAVYALALHRYWEHSHDLETIAACYDSAALALNDLAKDRNNDGLLDNVPGWLFIDNTFQLSRRPVSSALNASYAGALRVMSELAKQLDKKSAAEQWTQRYHDLRSIYRSTFLKNDRLLDSLYDKDALTWWNHHATAAGNPNTDAYLLIQSTVTLSSTQTQDTAMAIAHYGHCKILVDDKVYYDEKNHGTWTSPPLDSPHNCQVPLHNGCTLTVIYAYSAIDWEVYIGVDKNVSFENTRMQSLSEITETPYDDAWTDTAWHPHERPLLSHVSIGLAAEHGLLEEHEAQQFLRACLVGKHYEPWRKRTTPFFVEICTDRQKLAQNILPSNTPWALYPFCCALRRYGMLAEAQDILRKIYQHMLDQGATSFWEEWGTSSSLCHAWSAFVAEFLLTADHEH